MTASELVSVTAPQFCAGLVLEGGRVSGDRMLVAPVLRRFIGQPLYKLADEARARGWKIEKTKG